MVITGYVVVDGSFRSTNCIFFFNDTATTEIYTLSLHDALPISMSTTSDFSAAAAAAAAASFSYDDVNKDRKSTRLNSSHSQISYAVFCLKKKKKKHLTIIFHKIPTAVSADMHKLISHSIIYYNT